MFTALLDTCVLWPSLQRDFLLSLAVEGMYRPAWSSAILRELEYHETAKLIRRGTDQAAAESRAASLITQMRTAFDDAETTGWEGLEGSYGLPDPDDEHVVAAAVVAHADAIVTLNMKDFPQDKIPGSIKVIEPADFVASAVRLDPLQALAAVHAIAARSGRKGQRRTVGEILHLLEGRYAMSEAVETLQQAQAQEHIRRGK